MAQKLVRINSENPPGRELEIASFVAERLSELGLKARVDRFEDRANAVGSIRWSDGKTLLLLTHLDTVPAGSRENWRNPPFDGIIRGGRVYGRGAADAKGSLASMLGTLKSISDSGMELRGQLVVAAVADGEGKSRGVKRLLSRGMKADYAVVGEPTELLVCTANKGRLTVSARFLGKSAHPSSPKPASNPIQAAKEFLLKIDEELVENLPSHPILGRATIAPTIIRGGLADNVIPDEVEVTLDRRVLPGEELEAVMKPIRKIAEEAAEKTKIDFEVAIRKWIPPAESDSETEIAKIAVKAVSDKIGRKVKPAGFAGTSDTVFLVHAGIPTIILGPGSLEQAHSPDEWISVSELADAAEIYASIIAKVLGRKT